MPEYWVCAVCAMMHGLRGSEVSNWPLVGDLEAQIEHIERVHGIPVRREGETVDQAHARFARQYREPI